LKTQGLRVGGWNSDGKKSREGEAGRPRTDRSGRQSSRGATVWGARCGGLKWGERGDFPTIRKQRPNRCEKKRGLKNYLALMIQEARRSSAGLEKRGIKKTARWGVSPIYRA